MRTRWRFWPLLGIIFVFAVHTDILLVSHASIERRLGIGPVTFFVAISIFSFLQLAYEYWFLGWCKRAVIEQQKKDLWGRISRWLLQEGALWGVADLVEAIFWCIEIVVAKLKILLQKINVRDHPKFRSAIIRGGYPTIFFFSILPIPGFRTPSLAVCWTANIKHGFTVIALGNAIRIAYLLWLAQ